MLGTKNVKCSERVPLCASVSLQSLIFKELLLAVFYVSHRV